MHRFMQVHCLPLLSAYSSGLSITLPKIILLEESGGVYVVQRLWWWGPGLRHGGWRHCISPFWCMKLLGPHFIHFTMHFLIGWQSSPRFAKHPLPWLLPQLSYLLCSPHTVRCCRWCCTSPTLLTFLASPFQASYALLISFIFPLILAWLIPSLSSTVCWNVTMSKSPSHMML